MTTTKKTIGLLVGDELDWPDTIEALMTRLGPTFTWRGKTYEVGMRRLRIDPFNLRDPSKYDLVIDRLAYWHFTPREWLKKAALVNGTYLLNNPFSFQAMEKHSAYCAMIRLGLNIPDTWLIPQKQAPDLYKDKFRRTAERYHDLFDLGAIAEKLGGYPLYMKPFDGGGWRGVTRIDSKAQLYRTYDASGQMIMHLQRSIENYDIFCRSLAIGPQVINLKFQPEKPQHARYAIDHGFLDAAHGREVRIIVKLINAFFRWDFNSCETIHKDGVVYPIDFANACPDIAVNSLHYYYPWAISSLMAWSLFCTISGRPMKINLEPQPYFDIADSDRSYDEKLTAYEALADAHFQKEEFEEFKAECLPHLDRIVWELFQGADFDAVLRHTVQGVFPPHEHAAFYYHFKGLIGHWIQGQKPRFAPEPEEPAAEAAVAEAAVTEAEPPVEA